MTTYTISGPFGPSDALVVPLTTIWTPPCSSIVQFEYFSTSSCAPPEYESVWYNYGYYSPGICPSGYTSGCVPTDEYGGPLKASETAALCVPSGYTCADFELHASTVDSGETISVPAFQIRWKEADLAILETNPTDPGVIGAATTTSPTGSETGSSDPSFTPEPTPSGSGISKGAIAGIVVGVALAVATIAAAFFLWYRRRHLKPQGLPAEQPTVVQPPGGGMAELSNESKPHARPVMDSSTYPAVKVSELHTDVKFPTELDSAHQPVIHVSELPSNQPMAPTQVSLPASPSPISPAVQQVDSPSEMWTQQPVARSGMQTIQPSALPPQEVANQNFPMNAGGQETEVNALLARQAQLQSMRQTLLGLQQIEQEEAMIQQRLSQLHPAR